MIGGHHAAQSAKPAPYRPPSWAPLTAPTASIARLARRGASAAPVSSRWPLLASKSSFCPISSRATDGRTLLFTCVCPAALLNCLTNAAAGGFLIVANVSSVVRHWLRPEREPHVGIGRMQMARVVLSLRPGNARVEQPVERMRVSD